MLVLPQEHLETIGSSRPTMVEVAMTTVVSLHLLQ